MGLPYRHCKSIEDHEYSMDQTMICVWKASTHAATVNEGRRIVKWSVKVLFIYSICCVKACLSNELRAATCQISFWRVVSPLGVIASAKNSSGGIIAAQAVQMQLSRFEEFTSDA